MKNIRIKVPATTANLGPGFDSLGIALQIYNVVTVSTGTRNTSGDMTLEAAEAFFKVSKRRSFCFNWKIEGTVPCARGLGSSVTVRLGLLYGLNELSGRPLNKQQLFEICSDLEGHPDNAAPAAFGGFTIALKNGKFQRYKVDSSLFFVLLVPNFKIATRDARRVLPKSVPFHKAALCAGNAAALAAAFATKNYKSLSGCFEDYLHQPYRQKLIPCLPNVIKAGCEAGALGGWLSGSGSAIACLSLHKSKQIARAMLSAATGLKAQVIITHADNTGARLLIN